MVARNTIHLDGSLGTTGERWSVGFTYTLIGGGAMLGQADMNLWAGYAAGFSSSSSQNAILDDMSPDCTFDTVRCYGYGPTGGAIVSSIATVTPVVGTGTGRTPNQVARCLSLQTGVPGARARGRSYFPATGAVMVTGTRKSDPPSGYLTGIVAMLNRFKKIDAAGSEILELVVHSRVGNIVTPVTGVRLGDVLDTQRRRRDALVETYTTASL